MEWENKFHSIVKETEENLAKAKEKLTGKPVAATSILSSSLPPSSTTTTTTTTTSRLSTAQSASAKSTIHPAGVSLTESSSLTMTAASGLQILHMQEQIDSQNRTIERLQKLIRSLDNERDYYKEQISSLKTEIDRLTDRMTAQLSLANSERQVTTVKREVMREIDLVKSMLQSYAKDANQRTSPRFDAEFWTIKDNLTDSLEHVRNELSQMKSRIDRMESQFSADVERRGPDSRHDRLSKSYQSPKMYTPGYRSPRDLESAELQQLRFTISALNTKLDNMERKIDLRPTFMSATPNPQTVVPSHFLKSSFLRERSEDLNEINSFSDMSDLSNLSDNDLDDENDLPASFTQSGGGTYRKSIYKSGPRKKGKVEFDLSDLDLSDVEEDVDLDSLDLDS